MVKSGQPQTNSQLLRQHWQLAESSSRAEMQQRGTLSKQKSHKAREINQNHKYGLEEA
jgi:hypothetical protein